MLTKTISSDPSNLALCSLFSEEGASLSSSPENGLCETGVPHNSLTEVAGDSTNAVRIWVPQNAVKIGNVMVLMHEWYGSMASIARSEVSHCKSI